MEEIKKLLTENEEILWSGKPAEGSRREVYLDTKFALIITSVMIGFAFFYVSIMIIFVFKEEAFFFILFFAIGFSLIIIIPFFCIKTEGYTSFIDVDKNPIKGLFYFISNKKIYVISPEIDDISLENGEDEYVLIYEDSPANWIHKSIIEIKENIVVIDLNKIEKIRIKQNLGYKKYFGWKGSNIVFTYLIKRLEQVTFELSQIEEIEDLIKIIKEKLPFKEINKFIYLRNE